MTILLLFIFLVFILISIIFLAIFAAQLIAVFTTDAPFVSVPKEIIDEIIVNLELESNSHLFDLGCGNAKLLVEASKRYPNILATGVEIGFLPYFIAKIKTFKYRNIKIIRENIFKTDLNKATHIFLYLYPSVINKLLPQIRLQCRPGTTIVSCDFQFKEIIPSKVEDLSDINPSFPRGKKLYIYKI